MTPASVKWWEKVVESVQIKIGFDSIYVWIFIDKESNFKQTKKKKKKELENYIRNIQEIERSNIEDGAQKF